MSQRWVVVIDFTGRPVFLSAPWWVEQFVFLFWVYTLETGHLIYVLAPEKRHINDKNRAGEIYFTSSSLLKYKYTGDEWRVDLRSSLLRHFFLLFSNNCSEQEIGNTALGRKNQKINYLANYLIIWWSCCHWSVECITKGTEVRCRLAFFHNILQAFDWSKVRWIK